MKDELGITHERAVDRYRWLIWHLGACNAIYGLMRRSELAETGGYGSKGA